MEDLDFKVSHIFFHSLIKFIVVRPSNKAARPDITPTWIGDMFSVKYKVQSASIVMGLSLNIQGMRQ